MKNPLFAVNASIADPLPHQVEAVSLFPSAAANPVSARRRYRCRQDDHDRALDQGAALPGSTPGVLIITPGGLTKQWKDEELQEKFGLYVRLVNRASFDAEPGQFCRYEEGIFVRSIDFLALNEGCLKAASVRASPPISAAGGDRLWGKAGTRSPANPTWRVPGTLVAPCLAHRLLGNLAYRARLVHRTARHGRSPAAPAFVAGRPDVGVSHPVGTVVQLHRPPPSRRPPCRVRREIRLDDPHARPWPGLHIGRHTVAQPTGPIPDRNHARTRRHRTSKGPAHAADSDVPHAVP